MNQIVQQIFEEELKKKEDEFKLPDIERVA